jgi:thiamine biosynthesis lipoprotein
LLLCVFLFSCEQPTPSRYDFVLGTVCNITLYNDGKAKIYDECFARLHQIEDLMSVNKTGTEMDAVNAAAGIRPVEVGDDIIKCLRAALHFAELSGGVFDPTVGPLVKIWDIGGDNPRVPSQAEIDNALSLINYKDIVIDQEAKTVYLKQAGMAIDLGAIAKGYAADCLEEILVRHRVKQAIVDLGGNVLIYGEKADKKPWRIGVQDPRRESGAERGDYLGIVEVNGEPKKQMTLVTSGVYERYFEKDGKHYHHILSTKDGYPIENGLMSVSIITDSSTNADALSTTCFALGYDKAKELIESMPGVGAVFVYKDKTLRVLNCPHFILTNEEYSIEDGV